MFRGQTAGTCANSGYTQAHGSNYNDPIAKGYDFTLWDIPSKSYYPTAPPKNPASNPGWTPDFNGNGNGDGNGDGNKMNNDSNE